MGIKKLIPSPRAISACAVIAALTFSCIAEAVSIGEVVLQSALGEPLLAQVDLMVGSGESIDDSCLSLVAPDPHEDDISGYLTKANLSLKTREKRQYVIISSRKPFNDAFAKLRLQVKCPGMGSIIKTLTILPDMEAPVQQAPIAAPGVSAEAVNAAAPSPSDSRDIALAANQRAPRNTQPVVEKHFANKTARPFNKQHLPSLQTARKRGRSESFMLKLSGDLIDESRIGKISAEERTSLLAQQKLLDADDQTARFLAMQHQLKQMQEELEGIKLQMAKLGGGPSSVASSPVVSASPSAMSPVSSVLPLAVSQVSSTLPLATSGVLENRPKSEAAVKRPVVKQDNSDWQNGLFWALVLVLVVLALRIGLRDYTKIKSRLGINFKQADAKQNSQASDSAPASVAPAIIAPGKPKSDRQKPNLNFTDND